MYKNVYVNQCGYQPGMRKQVTIRSDKPVSFSVLESCGTCVFTGMADKKIESLSAGETDYVGDFSGVTTPGTYYIMTENNSESDTFQIGERVYDDLFQKASAFFYLQRCGSALPRMAAGKYAHSACHTGLGTVYGSDEKKEVSGGWHDAGDFGRYVGPGAMAVAQLLYAYERQNSLCDGYQSPERAGYIKACVDTGEKSGETAEGQMPEFLEELKYELDWMMKMQREDGALYHKATCHNFCAFIMPDRETEEMVISPVSATATGDFAAVCAMAVRFYEKYDKLYAKKLEEVSRKAYEALKTLDIPGGFKNPPDITTGEYGDECDVDERYWAAAELYKAFGDEAYRRDFEAIAAGKIYQGYGWGDMGSYGNLAYLSTTYPTDERVKASVKKAMLEQADRLLGISEADGYGNALNHREYVWGSNMNTANNGLMLYDAWVLTGERKYLDAAAAQLHYLLGRNPMGLCYVTGCGTDAIKHPHHRPSGFMGAAMPGMLSGGPCDWMADEAAKQILTKETAPAKCLVDMTGSYSTNEVTIYWNSALLQLLTSVME